MIDPAAQAAIGQAFYGASAPLEAREERDRAFLAGLYCTAEQQAELDAMDG